MNASILDKYTPNKHCFFCGAPPLNKKYCNAHLSIGKNLVRYTELIRTLELLEDRGNFGADLTGMTWGFELVNWGWATKRDNGNWYLTQRGKTMYNEVKYRVGGSHEKV